MICHNSMEYCKKINNSINLLNQNYILEINELLTAFQSEH